MGRAFYDLSTDAQRALLETAVMIESPLLEEWWAVREQMLRLLEAHLYEGGEIDEEALARLGEQFGEVGGEIALTEARAFAEMEDRLTETQLKILAKWREDPEQAIIPGSGRRISSDILERDDLKQLEDLFAKCFSWITGSPADNRIIPLGQPAQFFGFVSIRHKSGHAASRGQIAKSFLGILNRSQEKILRAAVSESAEGVSNFLSVRDAVLTQLLRLRDEPSSFDSDLYAKLSRSLGVLEAQVAAVEARAYRNIRESMTAQQVARMMDLRSDYIIDQSQVELLDADERGAALYVLCTGCHGMAGKRESHHLGPSLVDIVGRPIASTRGYEYSQALRNLADAKAAWTRDQLDAFLKAPKHAVPGTKMEFAGLLQADDRAALIGYLEKH